MPTPWFSLLFSRRVQMFLLLALWPLGGVQAGPLWRAWRERRAARQVNQEGETSNAALPARVKRVPDVSFGKAARQRFDVYAPEGATNAPVIFMVHGGAWRFGDKTAAKVVDNKVARWVPKGFVFISTNYRLMPEADPLEQARDVARAIALAQNKAASWGGDPSKFILMGHSAGAHLVALLTAAPNEAFQLGVRPWLGVVCLDSAALDLVAIMESKPPRLYTSVFGDDPTSWKRGSPFHVLVPGAAPFLCVYSTQRDNATAYSKGFIDHAASLRVRAEPLGLDLNHGQINEQLGMDNSYTATVETFMGSLDETVRRVLTNR